MKGRKQKPGEMGKELCIGRRRKSTTEQAVLLGCSDSCSCALFPMQNLTGRPPSKSPLHAICFVYLVAQRWPVLAGLRFAKGR